MTSGREVVSRIVLCPSGDEHMACSVELCPIESSLIEYCSLILRSIEETSMVPEDSPSVSIIIPCRNEEAFIARCLDSILGNRYPANRLEVIVVDGTSHDRTRDIVAQYARQHSIIRLVDNPKATIPAAMNIGMRQ